MLHLSSLAVAAFLAAAPLSSPTPHLSLPQPDLASIVDPSSAATPDWLWLATCTNGSFRWVSTGECCGVGLTKTVSVQQQCVNGAWVDTGLFHCALPACPNPP